MPGQQQQPQSGGGGADNSLDFFWIIALIVVALLLIWYFGKPYIVTTIFVIRHYEILAVSYVLTGYAKVAAIVGLPLPDFQPLQAMLSYMRTTPAKTVPFDTVQQISILVGEYYRFPVMIILPLLGVWVYFGNLGMKFQRTFNMNKLKDQEQHNWPQIMPVSRLDLIKEDIEEGPWAMAQQPLPFAKEHKLVEIIYERRKPKIKLLKGAAYRYFAMQLGPLYRGPESLAIHVQALFAIFAARGNRDREAADHLLDQIAKSAGSGKLDFSGAKELLAKHYQSKLVQRAVSRHAYYYTVMTTMLEVGRTDGVLATSEFLWLKPLDRRLWYVLNNLGRRAAFSECAGPYAHWRAEKEIGVPLKVPMVDQAVSGLQQALDEILYEEED